MDSYLCYSEISHLAGRLGAKLFIGYLKKWTEFVERPQSVRSGSWQGYPRHEDFAVDPNWSVQRVVRFVKGVRALGVPYLDIPPGTSAHDPNRGNSRYFISDAEMRERASVGRPLSVERVMHCHDGDLLLQIQREELFDESA
ncbi:MAG: hypothetical protein MI754_04205 [Chromatiales bacterium]|nr:hypothetical protein [Chromatiales bacterium]